MSSSDSFDVLVIGAGPAGYVCAIRAAQLGFKTGCIDARKTLGGTCLNVGCIPSKALLESSHHFYSLSKHIKEHGIEFDNLDFNLKKMLSRKNDVVKKTTQGINYLFKKNKIEHICGFASFEDVNLIKVLDSSDKQRLVSAKHIVIATGSEAIEIPSATFDHNFVVDSTDALNFSSVPERLLVVGGGVIGLELGSVWSRLGSKVTVIEASNKILGTMDTTLTQQMQNILELQDFSFHLGSTLERTEVINNKEVHVFFKKNNEELKIEADKVLIAVGRKPALAHLNVDSFGISCDSKGKIVVDHNYKTSLDNVYAIGDIISGPMLAHKASEEGVALAEKLAGKPGHINYRAIPNVVYTWPEIASVGLSEEECREQNLDIKVGKFNYKANGRARAMGELDGLVKIIADKHTDKMLGFHILGAHASELIAEAAIAFEYDASAEDIARSMHAHPTLAEIMKEAALDLDKRAIHH